MKPSGPRTGQGWQHAWQGLAAFTPSWPRRMPGAALGMCSLPSKRGSLPGVTADAGLAGPAFWAVWHLAAKHGWQR